MSVFGKALPSSVRTIHRGLCRTAAAAGRHGQGRQGGAPQCQAARLCPHLVRNGCVQVASIGMSWLLWWSCCGMAPPRHWRSCFSTAPLTAQRARSASR